jgi:hypothetical protein
MYDPGKGIFGDVSGSLHNIPMHMQDNGRVAQQVPTPGQVQIHNPAIHMSNSALQQGMTAYSDEVQYGKTGPMGYYQTKIHNAAMYSTLAAEKRAREARSDLDMMSNLSGAAQIGLGLMSLVPGVGLPFAVASAGLMAADYFMADGNAYYKGFQNRMSDISGIKNVMQGTGPAMINQITGRASENAALQYLSNMNSIASDVGVTSGDLHGINTMAAQSGLFQGHGGSVGQLSQRLRQVAKLTKQIMDIGSGISAQDAMEIQRLSNEMDIDNTKFNTMDIGKRIIGAAKLSGRTIGQMGQVMMGGAQMSSQMGLGAAVGADIALFNDAFVSSSYSNLGSATLRKVGSREQFASTLNAAHAKFASSISSSLVGQSMYVDPSTGEVAIDDGSAGLFQVGRKAALEANRRFRRTFTGEAGGMLSSAGVSSRYIQSIIGLQSADLAKSAAEGMDPERRMELMLREAMVESQRLKIDPRAFLVRKYGKQAADAVMVQAKEFRDSAASRSLDRYKQNLEYHAGVAAMEIPDPEDTAPTKSERIGRAAATVEAELMERATEEAMGIFNRRGAGSNLGIMDVSLKDDGRLNYVNQRRLRRKTLYNAYVGANSILERVKEDNDLSLSAAHSSSAQAEYLSESLLGKYLISRGKQHDAFFDIGVRRGVQSDILGAANIDFAGLSESQRNDLILSTSRTDRELSMDLRALDAVSKYSTRAKVGDLLNNTMISDTFRKALENMDPDQALDANRIAAERVGIGIARSDISVADLYNEAGRGGKASQFLRESGLDQDSMRLVKRATEIFMEKRDEIRAGGTGTLSEIKDALDRAGMAAQGSDVTFNDPRVIKAFLSVAAMSGDKKLQKHMSNLYKETRGVVDPAGGVDMLEFDVRSLGMESEIKGSTDPGYIFDGRNYNLSDYLYDPGTDSTEISQEDAERRLLELGGLAAAVGGRNELEAVAGVLMPLAGKDNDISGAIDIALNTGGLDRTMVKNLKKLKGSKHLAALARLTKRGAVGHQDLGVLLDGARGLKQSRALKNVIESLEDTGFEGLLGTKATQANKVIQNLNADREASQALSSEALSIYRNTMDAGTALEKFGLNMEGLEEEQKTQLKNLFKDTIGAEGASGLGAFQKELFKILQSQGGSTAGKGKGGKTSEDSTMSTIRSFDAMIQASAMMMVALTKPKEEGAKDLKRAQSMLQELAARAQVT